MTALIAAGTFGAFLIELGRTIKSAAAWTVLPIVHTSDALIASVWFLSWSADLVHLNVGRLLGKPFPLLRHFGQQRP